MISNVSDINPILTHQSFKDNNEIWSVIADLSSSHKLLFDFFNMLQERIIHLEKDARTCAAYPRSMQ